MVNEVGDHYLMRYLLKKWQVTITREDIIEENEIPFGNLVSDCY